MFLLKKISFYLFIAASIALAIWGYFRLKESKEPNAHVLEHIPANALCVIETKRCSELIAQLTRQNLIWNALLNNASMQVAQNGIRFLDSLVNASPEITEAISGNPIYWSFIKKGTNTEHLILFKVKEWSNSVLFEAFFKKSFTKDASISSIDAYSFTNNKQKWLLCYKNGIVYLCSDFLVLDDCLGLNVNESMANNKAYSELVKNNGNQNTQIYFNHTLINLLPKHLFTQQSLLGVEVNLNEITMTGYSHLDNQSFFDCLKNQEAEILKGYEFLPNHPDIIQGLSLSNVELFYRYAEQQQSQKQNEKNASAWKYLNDSALYNIKNESYENIENEIFSATYVLENVTSQILTLKIKDAEKSEFLLKLMSDSIVTLGEQKVYTLSPTFSHVFSFNTTEFKHQYACLINGYLSFFSNRAILNYYQEAVINSQLLGKDKDFMSYANENLALNCNYLYYENASLLRSHNLNSLFNSEELWMSEDAMSQVSLIASKNKKGLQVRLNACHSQPKTDTSGTSHALWTFKADSIISTSVHVFKNHLTQENELCFQDDANDVYLISSTGNLVWKKNISEKVQSAFYTVDIFKNGKFQVLFNTDNYLHLIDRNGNYVKGFPVKLPAKATSKLSMLDYEGNKDYRLFLACADHTIYNFNLYGIKTEGFVPYKTVADVTLPIYYVKVGASDYLLTADVSGSVYAFSRKGQGRIDFKNTVIPNLTNLFVLGGNTLENTKLIYVDDKTNLMYKISLSDKKESLKLGDELNDFNTSFALLDDDLQADVLLYGNGAIYAYNLFSSKLLEYFNDVAVYKNVQTVQTSNQQWIMGYDVTGQKVDVISPDGKLVSSLSNVTQIPFTCDLYKDGKTYVLLVQGNSVSCQELK